MRVTAACPEDLISDARHLAMVLGFGPEDADTYGEASWQDAAGNLYACASWICIESWVLAALIAAFAAVGA